MTSVEELEFASKYTLDLIQLKNASKPHINLLTMQAETNTKFASVIVEAIEKHIKAVKTEKKLPVLYLIDSILKNVKGEYINLFEQHIDETFIHVFSTAQESIRLKMWKIRSLWSTIFSNEKLQIIDAKCHELDKEWPVIKSTTTANISRLPSSSSSTSSTTSSVYSPCVSEKTVLASSPKVGTTPIVMSPNLPKIEAAITRTTAAVMQEMFPMKRSMSPLIFDYNHQKMQANLDTSPESGPKRARRESSCIILDDTSIGSHHEMSNQINYQNSNDSQNAIIHDNLPFTTTLDTSATPPLPTFVNNDIENSAEGNIIMQQQVYQPPPPLQLQDCSDISVTSNPNLQNLNRNAIILVQDDGSYYSMNDCETDNCDDSSPPNSATFDSSNYSHNHEQFQNQIREEGQRRSDGEILAQEERIHELEEKLQQAINEKVQEQQLFDTIQKSYDNLERDLQMKFKDKLRQFNKDMSQQLTIALILRKELEKKEAVNLELNGIIKGLSDRNIQLEQVFLNQMQLLQNVSNDTRIVEAATVNNIADQVMRAFMPALPIHNLVPTAYEKIFETHLESHLALEIFQNLEFHDLLSCSQVCTRWSEIVTPLLVTKTPMTNPDELEHKAVIENILKANPHEINIHYCSSSKNWQVVQVTSPSEAVEEEDMDLTTPVSKPLQELIPAFNSLPFIFREVTFFFDSGDNIESEDAQNFFKSIGKSIRRLKLNLTPLKERSPNAVKKETLQNLLTVQAPNIDSLELILPSAWRANVHRIFYKKVNLNNLRTLKLNLNERFHYGHSEILKELLDAAINLKTFETSCNNNNNNASNDGKTSLTFSLDYLRTFLRTDQLHTINTIDYLVPATDLMEHYELFAQFSRNMANAPHSCTQIKCLGIDLRGLPNNRKVWTKLMSCINTLLNSHYRSMVGLVCHGLVQNWYKPGFHLDFPPLPVLERLKIVINKDALIFPTGFNFNHLFPALRVLYFDFGSCTSVKWKNILPELQPLPLVKKVVLRLSGNHSAPASSEYVREIGKACPNVEDLTICYLYHFIPAGMVLWKGFPQLKRLHLNLVISNEKNPCESIDCFFSGYLRNAVKLKRTNPTAEFLGNRRICREFPSIVNMKNLEDLRLSFHGNFRQDRQSSFPNLLSQITGDSFNEMEKDLRVTFCVSSLKNVRFQDRESVKNCLIPFGSCVDDNASSPATDEMSFSYFMNL